MCVRGNFWRAIVGENFTQSTLFKIFSNKEEKDFLKRMMNYRSVVSEAINNRYEQYKSGIR